MIAAFSRAEFSLKRLSFFPEPALFESREPSVQEVFTKPMSDADDPHRRFPWGSGKVERLYYGSQLFVNKFRGYGVSTVDPTKFGPILTEV